MQKIKLSCSFKRDPICNKHFYKYGHTVCAACLPTMCDLEVLHYANITQSFSLIEVINVTKSLYWFQPISKYNVGYLSRLFCEVKVGFTLKLWLVPQPPPSLAFLSTVFRECKCSFRLSHLTNTKYLKGVWRYSTNLSPLLCFLSFSPFFLWQETGKLPSRNTY